MTEEDYEWCYDDDDSSEMEFDMSPSGCTGYDVCGSDGCDIESCGFDCGRDCYTD